MGLSPYEIASGIKPNRAKNFRLSSITDNVGNKNSAFLTAKRRTLISIIITVTTENRTNIFGHLLTALMAKRNRTK